MPRRRTPWTWRYCERQSKHGESCEFSCHGRNSDRRSLPRSPIRNLGIVAILQSMRGEGRPAGDLPTDTERSRPAGRLIAGGKDWAMSEFVCRAGPHDRPFEERHDYVAIAAVIDGSFTYRTDSGRALLYPGSFLLGNFGACFECGHDHSTGDRCISIHFSPEYFAEISATAAGSSRYTFPAATLPVAKKFTSAIVGL